MSSTRELESPERYFWWSGIAAISAVVRKQVFIDRGGAYKLYPNVFILLVSSGSGLRKGLPISRAKDLIEKVNNTRVISGMNSIEGIIMELSTQRTLESGAVLNNAQGILLSDEFHNLVLDNPQSLTVLTALYNTHEHEKSWKKTLKNSPIEELKSPCITLFGGSNEALFNAVVRKKDMEGGFIARTFIVYESKRKCINPLIKTAKSLITIEEQSSHLLDVSKVSGEFKWDNLASEEFIRWYTAISQMESTDKTGSLERLGDQAIKVAMLISLASKLDLVILKPELEEAIDQCEACIEGTKRVSIKSIEGNAVSNSIEVVMKAILYAPNHEIRRQILLRKTWSSGVDSMVLDRVIEHLIQEGAIDQPRKIKFEGGKIDIFYKVKEEAYQRYVKFESEARKEIN